MLYIINSDMLCINDVLWYVTYNHMIYEISKNDIWHILKHIMIWYISIYQKMIYYIWYVMYQLCFMICEIPITMIWYMLYHKMIYDISFKI